MCCIGFNLSHDVLQQLSAVEHCWPLQEKKTKKPITTNRRSEDYVRLPFVDDLCLHSAMQDFLRRKLSGQAKLTGRQIKLNRLSVNIAATRVSSPATYLKTIYNQRNFHMNAIQGHAYQGMVGLHMCVPEIFGIIAFSWLLWRLIRLQLVVLLQRWNCVVDWSRRLPTLTIYKRSSLWCAGCPKLPWQTATRCWLFSGRNARSQIAFVVRLNLSTYLPSQVQSLQVRINEKFHFTPILFNIKSPIGRSRPEFAKLHWLSTCNQRDH